MIKNFPTALSCRASMSRRTFLASGGALALCLPPSLLRVESGFLKLFTFKAGKGAARLVTGSHLKTDVWIYNETVPGSEIRARQGDRVRIMVENILAEETTVQLHELRVSIEI